MTDFTSPRSPRSGSRRSLLQLVFQQTKRYEVFTGCFGQYGSAWRSPTGCTLEIGDEELVLHWPPRSEPATLTILLSSIAAQDLSVDQLAARAEHPRLRLCLELATTPSCTDATAYRHLQRAMAGGPSLCILELGLASAGPLVDALHLAEGLYHQPNREAPPV